MKTLKAVVAKYNQTSLILRILIGLAVGSVLALVAPVPGVPTRNTSTAT